MIVRIILIYLIFVFSNCLKSENEFSEVKLSFKLNSNINPTFKIIGEDQFIKGTFNGISEGSKDINFSFSNIMNNYDQ